jgi:hypothetical protein
MVRSSTAAIPRPRRQEMSMPRYVVQRTFPDGLAIPTTLDGAKSCLAMVENNAEEDVTWVTSYVSVDRTKSYCICEAASPESISRAATANGLPVDSISEVRVLDPYFYTGPAT